LGGCGNSTALFYKMRMRVILVLTKLSGTAPSRGGQGGLSCTQTGPGPLKAPNTRRGKKTPPPALLQQ
jgi:hypothetical protein